MNKTSRQAIGRARTALVFGQGEHQKAVISAIVVRVADCADGDRLSFGGTVSFSDSVKKHIRDIIVPLADRLLTQLGMSQKCYEMSAVNLGAASSHDIGINISGFSADVPIFLSLLSASLNIPVPDAMISMGHIASSEGDIRAVKALPAKIDAAVSDSSITEFICPGLRDDTSMAALSPREHEKSIKAMMSSMDSMRVRQVYDISELIRLVFIEEDIVLASLKEEFFNISPASGTGDSPIGNALEFLTDGNEKKFWNILGQHFLRGSENKGKELLTTFAQYHIDSSCCGKG
jgi:hypothetical protein